MPSLSSFPAKKAAMHDCARAVYIIVSTYNRCHPLRDTTENLLRYDRAAHGMSEERSTGGPSSEDADLACMCGTVVTISSSTPKSV